MIWGQTTISPLTAAPAPPIINRFLVSVDATTGEGGKPRARVVVWSQ
jgi:hypothetical protein